MTNVYDTRPAFSDDIPSLLNLALSKDNFFKNTHFLAHSYLKKKKKEKTSLETVKFETMVRETREQKANHLNLLIKYNRVCILREDSPLFSHTVA